MKEKNKKNAIIAKLFYYLMKAINSKIVLLYHYYIEWKQVKILLLQNYYSMKAFDLKLHYYTIITLSRKAVNSKMLSKHSYCIIQWKN